MLALAILVAGLGLLGYPVAMSWYEAWLAETTITTLRDVSDNMDDEP